MWNNRKKIKQLEYDIERLSINTTREMKSLNDKWKSLQSQHEKLLFEVHNPAKYKVGEEVKKLLITKMEVINLPDTIGLSYNMESSRSWQRIYACFDTKTNKSVEIEESQL